MLFRSHAGPATYPGPSGRTVRRARRGILFYKLIVPAALEETYNSVKIPMPASTGNTVLSGEWKYIRACCWYWKRVELLSLVHKNKGVFCAKKPGFFGLFFWGDNG